MTKLKRVVVKVSRVSVFGREAAIDAASEDMVLDAEPGMPDVPKKRGRLRSRKPDIFHFHLGLYPSKAAAEHAMSFMPEHHYRPMRLIWAGNGCPPQPGWGLVQQGCDYSAYKHNMLMAWKHCMSVIGMRK